MNPFDLPDKQFLVFYAVLFVAALIAAGRLRRRLSQPSDEPGGEALRVGPYEIAYLFGGKRLAVDAVIVRLVKDRVLAMNVGWRRLKPGSERLSSNAPELERAVYAAVAQDGTAVWRIRWAVSAALAPSKRRLQELGLMLIDDRAARFFPFAITAVVLALGVVKYFVGFSGDVDPGFLVMCWLMSAFLAVGGFASSPPRSQRGDHLLLKLRQDHAELASQVKHGADQLSGNQMALVAGLFGMGSLVESPAAELPKVLAGSEPLRLESRADLWIPILGWPAFGGLFLSVPFVGTPTEDSMLGTFGVVVIIGGFFGFTAMLLSAPRLEELVRRDAWAPPGSAAHPLPVAIALAWLVMATIAGLMVGLISIVERIAG